ncbi:hypothetical protein BH11PSE11_BH11PSE11_16500 [soil metagenome]
MNHRQKVDTGKADALFQKAFAAHGAGRFDEAEAFYRKALRITPDDMETLYLLGTVCSQLGKLDDAVKFLGAALKIAPNHVESLNSMGMTMRGQKKHAESAEYFRRALQIKPDYADALSNLGSLLEFDGKPEEAEPYLRRALELNPDGANVHYNLGLVLFATDRFEEAAKHFVRGLELNPNIPAAYSDLGGIYKRWGRLEEAVAVFDRGLKIAPDAHYLHSNRGTALEELGRFDEALIEYNISTELCPEDPTAKWNTCYLFLKQGILDPGWELHELRLKHGGQVSERFPYPRWDGSDLSGKTILIYAEQGLGDEIWFASCIPDLIARAKHCVIECTPRLASLYRRSFPTATVIGGHRMQVGWLLDVPKIDVQIAIGSMPLYLRPTLESFPSAPQYLFADPQRIDHWRARLAALGPGLKVGICWRSGLVVGERHKNYSELTQWGEIFDLSAVQFVNLQYDECTDELRAVEQKFGVEVARFPELDLKNELDDTTALISALDIVISAGTAVSELAGAAGVETYRLDLFGKPMDALGTGRSPWHPKMKLFGQLSPGDWSTPLALIAETLRQKSAGSDESVGEPSAFVALRDGTEIAVNGSLEDLPTYVLREQQQWFDPEFAFVTHLADATLRMVDIGAGVGIYSIPMSRKASAGRVFAYTATTEDTALLMKSTIRNRLDKLIDVMVAHRDLSLDAEMDKHGLDGIDLVRVAEGFANAEFLTRGKTFFSTNSPLLMFAIKPGAQFDFSVPEWLLMQGYSLYRLVPAQQLLVPFATMDELDSYALNLFACKADRAELLERQGCLIRQIPALEALPGVEQKHWQEYLRRMPYAAGMLTGWMNSRHKDKDWEIYWMVLNLFAMSRPTERGPASEAGSRYASLQTALAVLSALVQEQANIPRLLSLCRILSDLGKRETTIQLLNRICELLDSGLQITVDEPFLVLDDTFAGQEAGDRMSDWIRGMILQRREQLRAFSGFFTGAESLPVLREIQSLGVADAELDRRIDLLRSRFGIS